MPTQPILGILGGGQLAQMLALAAIPLGISCHIYEPDPHAPARLCAVHHCAAYDNFIALQAFADAVDVITYEFENVPVACVAFLAARKPVAPGAMALRICQDRLMEKEFATQLGYATAPFIALADALSSVDAVAAVGFPAILKTRRMGYDGKGQQTIQSTAELDAARAHYIGHELILEGYVPFTDEVSIIAARDQFGTVIRYPLVQNMHRDGILRRSTAPAPCSTAALEEAADQMAHHILSAFAYVGILAIECFVVDTPHGPTLVINEFAPRVHNSGHWSIEGSSTSQFENHVRAVTGLAVREPLMRGVAVMLNLIGNEPEDSAVPAGVAIHRYHKTPRPGRKVGHLTVVAPYNSDCSILVEACNNLPGMYA
jgi:5-(carboxyamino)imidazole ribonucleotide synthase